VNGGCAEENGRRFDPAFSTSLGAAIPHFTDNTARQQSNQKGEEKPSF
jgi:hypothetical protein